VKEGFLSYILAISNKTALTIFIKFEFVVVRKMLRYLVCETKISAEGF